MSWQPYPYQQGLGAAAGLPNIVEFPLYGNWAHLMPDGRNYAFATPYKGVTQWPADSVMLFKKEHDWLQNGQGQTFDQYTNPTPAPTPSANVRAGSRTLRRPMTGSDVRELKRLLNAGLDHTSIYTSEIFDFRTEAAVQAYQTARGLTPDGIVGPKTWAALLGNAPPVSTTAAPQLTGNPLVTPTTDAARKQQQALIIGGGALLLIILFSR